MSLDTLDRTHNPHAFEEQVHGDAEERTHLLEIADTLAEMEEQFVDAEPDEKQRLQALKDSLIEELTAENPGETLLNDVITLAFVYQRRVTESRLPQDGSTVKAFGTRNKTNHYLQETYILHEKADGGYHYLVKKLVDKGEMLFELDDEADLRITKLTHRLQTGTNRPQRLDPDSKSYQVAVKDFIETTLTATGEIRKRNSHERAEADRRSLFMIEDSPFAKQFLQAESSGEVMRHIDTLMVVDTLVLSQDSLKLIAHNRHSA